MVSQLFNHPPHGVGGSFTPAPRRVPSAPLTGKQCLFLFSFSFPFFPPLLPPPTPSSPGAEIRLRTEEWAQVCSEVCLFFFPPRHNFLPVNWSVFASVSTPAQQHPPPGAIGSQFVPFLHVARSCYSSGFLHRCLRVIFALRFTRFCPHYRRNHRRKLTRFPPLKIHLNPQQPSSFAAV